MYNYIYTDSIAAAKQSPPRRRETPIAAIAMAANDAVASGVDCTTFYLYRHTPETGKIERATRDMVGLKLSTIRRIAGACADNKDVDGDHGAATVAGARVYANGIIGRHRKRIREDTQVRELSSTAIARIVDGRGNLPTISPARNAIVTWQDHCLRSGNFTVRDLRRSGEPWLEAVSAWLSMWTCSYFVA